VGLVLLLLLLLLVVVLLLAQAVVLLLLVAPAGAFPCRNLRWNRTGPLLPPLLPQVCGP
jgi:hypothetical protein